MATRNFILAGVVTSLAAGISVYRAYSIKRQFYPTCVYLSKSNLSIISLTSFTIYLMTLFTYALKEAFFGSLRLIEEEHLQEYGWITLSESFLAMTIFRDEFDARFVILFCAILMLKSLHWIGRDRVDFMEQTPSLPKGFNQKMIALMVLLFTIDTTGLLICIHRVAFSGPSIAILFSNEFALLIVALLSITVRFTLNALDWRRGSPWEHRSVFLFYFDFVLDAFKLLVYSTFFGVIVFYYGIPLHIIRDLYMTVRSFLIRIKDIIRYRQATKNMNERYPDATAEELSQLPDKVCIICREEMISSVKKLNCGHCFHFRCLRSWLERQQACPTCRQSIFENQKSPSSCIRPADYPVQNRQMESVTSVNSKEETTDVSTVPETDLPLFFVPTEDIAKLAQPNTADSKEMYILKPQNEGEVPILLEPLKIGSLFSDNKLSSGDSNSVIRRQLRSEYSTLERLQLEVSGLYERLRRAESQLDKNDKVDSDDSSNDNR